MGSDSGKSRSNYSIVHGIMIAMFRISLEARELGGLTDREGKRVKSAERRQRVERKAGRVKSDLTNQREAASISTTHRHRFFLYPRPVSPFFTSPACFFYRTFASCASKMEAEQRVSRIKEENSTGILSPQSLSVSFPSFVVFDGFVGSAPIEGFLIRKHARWSVR